jgi:hypothetical protein
MEETDVITDSASLKGGGGTEFGNSGLSPDRLRGLVPKKGTAKGNHDDDSETTRRCQRSRGRR